MLIFDKSSPGRLATCQLPDQKLLASGEIKISKELLRTQPLRLPEVSELDVVRHYTNLSKKNFSIDGNFYPLGSCTMKYNPRGVHAIASSANFLARHPAATLEHSQGYMQIAYELQDMLAKITGMAEVSLTSMAGAQGELAGVLMIRAYHEQHNQQQRIYMLVPDSAHGTNPASAVMCGYKVKEIPTQKDGRLDLLALNKLAGPEVAGLMLTNPSTLGLFETEILEINQIIHDCGGLIYYDGANLNAILGRVRPADMGFDVMHMNLHKTFATPHGGGGPGCGPVAANDKLAPFLPVPMVGCNDKGNYFWLTNQHRHLTIGRLSAFMGNAGIIIRAYTYIRMLGKQGLSRVSEYAVLNSNYLMSKLKKLGFNLAFPNRIAAHEFIVTFKELAKTKDITALDFAKRLLDYGMHAPTIYFPLSVPECWLIEPTETEAKETLDRFAAILQEILQQAEQQPDKLLQAPLKLANTRLDEVAAAINLDVTDYR